MKNIVLVGLSGSGKTTLGQALAARLRLPFLDLDHEICRRAGCSVSKLFSGYGEDFFREMEAHTVRMAAADGGKVIATGGGAVLRQDNAAALRENGLVIFLDRPVDSIVSDIEFSHRPLLRQGEERLRAMAAHRRDTYLACAHLVLDNSGTQAQALEKLAAACLPLFHSGYAVIGDPIGHSLSPAIYSASFAALGVKADYAALWVPKGGLAEFVAGMRGSGLEGFNVTIPHKRAVLPLLDEMTGDAALCGAVNTVARKNGKLHGHNTDMEGLHMALRRAGSGYAGRWVLLLGAGGAARAVAMKAAAESASQLCILARRPEAAEELARHVHAATGRPVSFGGMTPDEVARSASACDLLVNATSLGMQGIGRDFEDTAFLSRMQKSALVCDLVYRPAETKLLAGAKARGLAALGGLDMLIYQAILAQEFYLDRELDRDALYDIIKKTLIESEDVAV